MIQFEKIDEYFTQHQKRHLQELIQFLQIPSISSLSEHKKDIELTPAEKKQIAEEIKAELESHGTKVDYDDTFTDLTDAEMKQRMEEFESRIENMQRRVVSYFEFIAASPLYFCHGNTEDTEKY